MPTTTHITDENLPIFITGSQTISGVKTFVDQINVLNANFNQEIDRFPFISINGLNFWSGWTPNTWYIQLQPSSFITITASGAGSSIVADWYATTGIPTPVGGIVPNAIKFNLLAKGTNLPQEGVLTGRFSAVGAGYSYTATGFLPTNTRYLHFLNPINGGGSMFLRVLGTPDPLQQHTVKIIENRLFINNSGVLFQGEAAAPLGNQILDPFFGDRPIRRLPVIDTNYSGTTISGFLNNLFFPYANAELSLSNFSVIGAYGYDTINSVTFAGGLNVKDDNVTGIACLFSNTILNGPSVPIITNNTYSISPVNFLLSPPTPPTRQSTTTEDFKTRIFGTRNGVQFTQDSSNIRLRFAPPYFYGISTNDNLSVNVTGLTRVNPSTYLSIPGSNYNVGSRPSFINGVQFTFNNSIPNGYIYFAYLDHTNTPELIVPWGQLATSAGIVDAVSFADYTSTYTTSTVQITFPTRSNVTYRIYRSPLITPLTLPTTFTLNFKFA